MAFRKDKVYCDTTKSSSISSKVKDNDILDPQNIYYTSKSHAKGQAIIFNHYEFDKDRISRLENTELDVERLEKFFNKMNFNYKTYQNLDVHEILKVMEIVSSWTSSQASCIIIVVMTHGKQGVLQAYDDSYEVENLWKKLKGKLIGVPKLFFIEACRGSAIDSGYEARDSAYVEKYKPFMPYKLPTMADFLFMYSTCEGYVSYQTKEGSFFIHALCDEVEEKSPHWDLMQILTFVNKRIAVKLEIPAVLDDDDEVVYEAKSMSQIVSMLTKLLKFNPTKETAI